MNTAVTPTREPPTRAPIERATPNDLLQLAYDVGEVPAQVGALLVMSGPQPDRDAVRRTIAARIDDVPRLRQRLQRVPIGCGRPIWVDDARFDIAHHVDVRPCPAPGDERALFDLAAQLITSRLDPARPPWAATQITGLAGGRWAVVVVFHHVLADGIGGLAVLAHLVDGTAPAATGPPPPRPAPARWRLAVDALRARSRAVADLPRTLRLVQAGIAEMLPGVTLRAPRTSLNRPTGPRRRLAVVRVPLEAVRTVAHDHGGTVNDVVLAAVAGALRAVVRERGEDLTSVVVSMPVSYRSAGGTELGNQVGMLPVTLPATGAASGRLNETARIVRARKQQQRGASAVVLAPLFRFLARLGAVRWLVDRQRMVTTFVTNMRGPAEPMRFLGAPVVDVIVVNGTTGNVSVAFGVLSYAGTLTVTVVADPDVCPDQDRLAEALYHELDELMAATPAGHRRAQNAASRFS
jgi:diacylglycerol O-acyltransferase / wax synthase